MHEPSDLPAPADTKPRIFSNTSYLGIGVVLNAIIGLYVTRALARYLGVSGYGFYALAFVYLNFTAVIANFGFDSILIREFARHKKDTSALATAGIVLKLAFAVAAVSVGTIYVLTRGYPAAYTGVVIILLLTHFVAAFDTFEIIHKVHLKGQNVAAASVLSQTLTLLAVLWGRAHSWPLEWLIGAHLIVRIPRVVYLYVRLRGVAPVRWHWDSSRALYILRESTAIGLTGILWVVYFRVDTLMLEWLKGPAEVGQYAAAYKFIELALLGSSIVMSSLGPLLAERWPDNPDGFRWLYLQSVSYISVLGAIVAGGMVVFGPDLIRNFYSVHFTDSIAILRILAITVIMISMNYLFAHTMVVVGIQGPGLWTTRVVGTVLNVILNLLWIPRWGAYGAAWATVVSEIVNLTLCPCFVRHRTGIWPRPWAPIFGVGVVWFSWQAYLAAGGGRTLATWPGRSAGVAVLVGAILIFLLKHRRQFLELLEHFRGRQSPAPDEE